MQPLINRLSPATGTSDLGGWTLVVVLALALLAATWWPAWRVLRLGVTLVHELGHAVVGMACGRRFTGFVLRSDMSGHAVTVGPARGAGVVATTWAGYPAPGLVGAAVVWLATAGWAAPTLTLLLVGLLAALTRVRSALTGLVVVAVLAAGAALWWWRDDALQQQVLVGLGVLLLVGAWRHLATMLGGIEARSDPGSLARATGVPAVLWVASFALVLAGASWLAAARLLGVVGG
ncbi:M50 family metallopeptidase [Helicobacter pylori]